MPRKRAPSKATKLALSSLYDAPKGLYGYEIMQTAGVKPGTLYPMLARLEDQGLLASEWQAPAVEGRPPRHVYTLSESGRVMAKGLLDAAESDFPSGLKPKSA